MLSISKKSNINYLAVIDKINDLSPHPNADKLQFARIAGEKIIVSKDVNVGDWFVYFPVDSVISEKILYNANLYANSELNFDKSKKGYFGKNGRVKSIKLRGEYSNGFLLPLEEFARIFDLNINKLKERREFDTVFNYKIVWKYIPPELLPKENKSNKTKKMTKCKDIILDNTVTFHVDTKNYRRVFDTAINPHDIISISTKIHGTNFHISNVLTKKRQTFFQKIFGIQKYEYKIIYGSRRVIKNKCDSKSNNDFYDVDIYKYVADLIKDKIPKNYQVYGEVFGYLPGTQQFIQKDYDYGLSEGQFDYVIFRVKKIDKDHKSIELSMPEIIEFCREYGLKSAHYLYYGYAKDLFQQIPPYTPDWHERFLNELEKKYLEKDCGLCNNKVPEEGIVIRKENMFNFEPYKLKSQRFLFKESKDLE